MIFEVDNIKCGGCANSINQKLLKVDGVQEVSVDIEKGQISVITDDHSELFKQSVSARLQSMGYPEKGSVDGFDSVKAKATSYVSCAIGKMTEN